MLGEKRETQRLGSLRTTRQRTSSNALKLSWSQHTSCSNCAGTKIWLLALPVLTQLV
jgi:hypothetical protein